jgi:hypothetical protein
VRDLRLRASVLQWVIAVGDLLCLIRWSHASCGASCVERGRTPYCIAPACAMHLPLWSTHAHPLLFSSSLSPPYFSYFRHIADDHWCSYNFCAGVAGRGNAGPISQYSCTKGETAMCQTDPLFSVGNEPLPQSLGNLSSAKWEEFTDAKYGPHGVQISYPTGGTYDRNSVVKIYCDTNVDTVVRLWPLRLPLSWFAHVSRSVGYMYKTTAHRMLCTLISACGRSHAKSLVQTNSPALPSLWSRRCITDPNLLCDVTPPNPRPSSLW